MTSPELDPLFVKGLRLLHSKAKDSTEQLKQLLDDVIAQTKQSSHSKERIYTSIKMEGDSKIHIKKTLREASDSSNFSSKISSEERDRKAEKRQLEKLKQENIEVEAKIPKLEPPQGYSYYPSSPPDLPTLDQYVTKKEEESDSSEENADADDFAMEMGLACVICKSLDVTQGNQLIECQECHNLYHQHFALNKARDSLPRVTASPAIQQHSPWSQETLSLKLATFTPAPAGSRQPLQNLPPNTMPMVVRHYTSPPRLW
ncbi:integrator complex subunit 12 [Trichonephila clavipes]|nr:integrator complex subunit 12 [Trichonephila clavipes]